MRDDGGSQKLSKISLTSFVDDPNTENALLKSISAWVKKFWMRKKINEHKTWRSSFNDDRTVGGGLCDKRIWALLQKSMMMGEWFQKSSIQGVGHI